DALTAGRPVPRANKANGIPVTPRDEAGGGGGEASPGPPDAGGWREWNGPAEEAGGRDGGRGTGTARTQGRQRGRASILQGGRASAADEMATRAVEKGLPAAPQTRPAGAGSPPPVAGSYSRRFRPSRSRCKPSTLLGSRPLTGRTATYFPRHSR